MARQRKQATKAAKGIPCGRCGSYRTKVTHSRNDVGRKVRWRECLACGNRAGLKTWEMRASALEANLRAAGFNRENINLVLSAICSTSFKEIAEGVSEQLDNADFDHRKHGNEET